MYPQLLPLLASPETGGPLELTATRQEGSEIISGLLTDASGHIFPIEDGIPRLLPIQLLDAQKSEIAARDAQVADYDQMAFLNAFGKIEIPLTQKTLGARKIDRLLEAGCGTGRMTPQLAQRVQEMVAIDFSLESLRVNAKKIKEAGIKNVHLVQADLCRLPFASARFDRVVSCQVLEHVPGPKARLAAVAQLARVLRPGGVLTLSAYKHSLFTKLFAQKEGVHEGGIPYFRFTQPELKALLASEFSVQSITGVLVYIYLARGVKK